MIIWPDNLPDLNPIESVWQVVKEKLRHTIPPQTIAKGGDSVGLDSELTNHCEKVVHLMRKRIQEVLKNIGYHSHYR